MRREVLRPLVHAGVGLGVLLTPLLGRWGMAGVAGAFVLVNALLLPRTRFGKALAREGEGRFGGLVTYPLAVALGYALFGAGNGALAWVVLAFGDPAASLVGAARRWEFRIPWNRGKSLAGATAFVLAGGAAALALAALELAPEKGLAFHHVRFIVAGVYAGAVAETLPLPLDDNLPVILAAGGMFALLAGV